MCRFGMAPVRHADGFTRYSGAAGADFAHEAGFDAFMTGSAYAGLLSLAKAAEALPPHAAGVECTTTTAAAASVTGDPAPAVGLQARPVLVRVLPLCLGNCDIATPA